MVGYCGSKQKLGKQIYNIIKQYDNNENPLPYLEPFCGMCGVLKHFASENIKRNIYANDINKDIILMWNALKQGWIPPISCSKKKYYEIKDMTKHTAERGFIGVVCSFGGIFFGSGFRNKSNTFDFVKSGSKNLCKDIEIMKKVKFSHGSYLDFDPKGFLIYCDPPYIDNLLNSKLFQNFNHEEFWNIMRKWSKNNIVIISEKIAPPDFICIWTKNYNMSVLNVKKMDNVKKHYKEKLFIHDSLYKNF